MLETLVAFPVDKKFGLSFETKRTFGLFLSTQPSKVSFSPSFWLRANDAEVFLFNSALLGPPSALQQSFRISHVQQSGAYLLVNHYCESTLESSLSIWNFTNGKKFCFTFPGLLDGLHVLGGNAMLLVDGIVYQLSLAKVPFTQLTANLDLSDLPCLSPARLVAHSADGSHLAVLGVDSTALTVYDSDFESVGNWKLSKSVGMLFERHGEDFVVATIGTDGVFSVASLQQAEIIELIYSVDLNFQKDARKWKLVRMRLIENMVTVLFVSDAQQSRIFQISIDSPKEPDDIMLEHSIEALDIYHTDSNTVNILFFDRVSQMRLEPARPETSVDVSVEFLNNLVNPQVVNYYKGAAIKDEVQNQRQQQTLIIDELLKAFSLNPASFYPPSSENKLVQLVRSVIACEDFEMAQKIAVLYYIASKAGYGPEFCELFGLDSASRFVVDAYREFDCGNYTKSVKLLCLGQSVDFPQLILETLERQGLKEDIRRFHSHFGHIVPSLKASIEIDLDSAFKFALRHDLMHEFMEIIFETKREKELALLPAYGELDKYVDDAYVRKLLPAAPQDRIASFYGIFLLSRSRFSESAKFLKKKKYLKFLDAYQGPSSEYHYRQSGLFVPVIKSVADDRSPDVPPQLIDYVPKPHSATPRRNNDSLTLQSLSPFSPPRPKNYSIPVVEVPVPPESVLVETGFISEPEEQVESVPIPVEEKQVEIHLPPKRKELLEEEPPKEYLFKARTSPRSRTVTVESSSSQKVYHPRVPEEDNSEDEFHDQSIHLESVHETPVKQPENESAMDYETFGWLGRLSTWLTPFKSTTDKRTRTGSADYDCMSYTKWFLIEVDKKVKSPRKAKGDEDEDENNDEEYDDDGELTEAITSEESEEEEEDISELEHEASELLNEQSEADEAEKPPEETKIGQSESELETEILPRTRRTRMTKSVTNSPEKPKRSPVKKAARAKPQRQTKSHSEVFPLPRVTRSAIKKVASNPETENSSRASSAPGSIATTPVPVAARKKRAPMQKTVVPIVEIAETPRTTRRTASKRVEIAPDSIKKSSEDVKDTPVQERRLPARRMLTRSSRKTLDL